MFAIGTIINTFSIALAGLLGSWFGYLLKERHQSGLTMASGIAILFFRDFWQFRRTTICC